MQNHSWIEKINDQKIAGWEFCLYWFEMSDKEVKYGHRKKFSAFLAKILNVSSHAPTRWGSRFEDMPDYHQATLFKIYVLHRLVNAPSPQDIIETLVKTKNS